MVAGSSLADRAVPVIDDVYPNGKTDGDVTTAGSVMLAGLTTMAPERKEGSALLASLL